MKSEEIDLEHYERIRTAYGTLKKDLAAEITESKIYQDRWHEARTEGLELKRERDEAQAEVESIQSGAQFAGELFAKENTTLQRKLVDETFQNAGIRDRLAVAQAEVERLKAQLDDVIKAHLPEATNNEK